MKYGASIQKPVGLLFTKKIKQIFRSTDWHSTVKLLGLCEFASPSAWTELRQRRSSCRNSGHWSLLTFMSHIVCDWRRSPFVRPERSRPQAPNQVSIQTIKFKAFCKIALTTGELEKNNSRKSYCSKRTAEWYFDFPIRSELSSASQSVNSSQYKAPLGVLSLRRTVNVLGHRKGSHWNWGSRVAINVDEFRCHHTPMANRFNLRRIIFDYSWGGKK